ncbi:flavodoxin family protein [Pelosinus baikalensis]|uniref:Flavodoxin family protein n=1 Tax=Pelosinus baikalensis TaxID=2892015 RepID=A0ABS8HWR9_9FIRM|nr:NAD(P)H-dependent oxidoreductase [Pelosinus baikalensis]MCC5466703.1 flavodoxin family protein [Pelosinus baikalensis]
MKVVTLLGSPKKNGKTAEALSMFEENILSKGHEVERIHLTDYTIKGCVGCLACMQKQDELGCALKDDAVSIFERMISADAIVYASPIYAFDFTSQIKSLIDRHLCLTIDYGSPNQTSFIDGKRVALLVTCGGPTEGNADLVQVIFDRSMMGVLKCNSVGKYIISLSSEPDFNDRAKEVTDKLARAII